MIRGPPRSTRCDTLFPYSTLFRSVGFLVGGIDDLAIDAIFLVRIAWLRASVMRRYRRARLSDFVVRRDAGRIAIRSEEHTSELQSLMRISYAVFCLKKKKMTTIINECRQRHKHPQKTNDLKT